MLNESKIRRDWWFLFPMTGLALKGRWGGLEQPVFGDATLLSKTQIRPLIQSLNLNRPENPEDDSEEQIIQVLGSKRLLGEFQSFMAVRRPGVLDQPTRSPNLVGDARSRAYEISAALTLILLAQSSSGQTCGLVEQVHEPQRAMITGLSPNGNGFWLSYGGGGSLTGRRPSEPIALAPKDLEALLYKEPFKALSQALLPQKRVTPRGLRRTLSQASVRLADAVHSATPAAQLLGAVTCIEMLVSAQNERYEAIEKRVNALIGDRVATSYGLDAALRARHLYVHQGQEVTEREVPVRAVALALACLLTYSAASLIFPTKDKLIQYLDFIRTAQWGAELWGAHERQAFESLLKHEPKDYDFPFADEHSEKNWGADGQN